MLPCIARHACAALERKHRALVCSSLSVSRLRIGLLRGTRRQPNEQGIACSTRSARPKARRTLDNSKYAWIHRGGRRHLGLTSTVRPRAGRTQWCTTGSSPRALIVGGDLSSIDPEIDTGCCPRARVRPILLGFARPYRRSLISTWSRLSKVSWQQWWFVMNKLAPLACPVRPLTPRCALFSADMLM